MRCVKTYEELRGSIPMLIRGLGKVAGLFVPGIGAGRVKGPAPVSQRARRRAERRRAAGDGV